MDSKSWSTSWWFHLLLVALAVQGVTPDATSLASSALVRVTCSPLPLEVNAAYSGKFDPLGFAAGDKAQLHSTVVVCVPPRTKPRAIALRERSQRGSHLADCLTGHTDPRLLGESAVVLRTRRPGNSAWADDPLSALCRRTC